MGARPLFGTEAFDTEVFGTEGFSLPQTSMGLVKRFEFGIRMMRSAASIVV